MDRYLKFRNDHPVFSYKSYRITETSSSVEVEYDFEIKGLAEFHPTWSFPKPENVTVSDDIAFERIVFSLGMAEAVSYWKAACSPEMRVDCGELSPEQIKWWKKLYYLGLGEFFTAFVLAEAVSTASDPGGLDCENEVVVVLTVEERHQPLLAGKALID